MKNILIVILFVALASVSFGKMSSNGHYYFKDHISGVKPIWKNFKPKSNEVEYSRYTSYSEEKQNSSHLTYYDKKGQVTLIQNWVEDRAKKKAKLIKELKVRNRICFDSVKLFQVELWDSDEYYYYDSVQFTQDEKLKYQFIFTIDKYTNDTTKRIIEIVKRTKNSIKYMSVSILDEDTTYYDFQNGRPIFVSTSKRKDSIVYQNYKDYTIVQYYFKNENDTSYWIGQKDSIRGELLCQRETFELYRPTNSVKENYYYDSNDRIILKSSRYGNISYRYDLSNLTIIYRTDPYFSSRKAIQFLSRSPYDLWNWKTKRKLKKRKRQSTI